MKTPGWYASYARMIPAMTSEQKLIYIEIADCILNLKSRLAQAERERDAAVVCIGHMYEAINKPVRKVSDTSNNLMNAKQIALNYVIELAKGVCPENTKEAES